MAYTVLYSMMTDTLGVYGFSPVPVHFHCLMPGNASVGKLFTLELPIKNECVDGCGSVRLDINQQLPKM